MIEIQAPNGQVIEIDGNTMPSEAELDEIFKSTGTMGELLTKSVMDAEDGKIYNVPMSMDGIDTNFNIQTQHKGMDKADFFGKVNFRFNPLEVQKDLIKRAKEGLEGKSLFDVAKVGLDTINKKTGDVTTPVVEKVGKNIAKAGVDFAGTVSNVAIDTFTGYQDLDKAVDNGEIPMSLIAGARVRADAFLNDTTYQESAKKLLESTKKLKEKNKKFFEQKSEKVLPSEEMDKFDKLLYGVSNGAASVGAAIGATLLTKNPTVGSAFTAGLFGSMQQSEYYDKSREAGFSAERSQFYGNIAGVINAGLEFVGDKALMSIGNVGGVKKITDNIAKATIEKLSANKATKSAAAKIASKHLNSVGKQALKGFASEFSEEASQTLAEDVLENLTDVSDMSFSDVLNDTLYAGFIGGLTGGLFGGASTAINNKTIKENNDKIKNLLSKISPDLNETELQATADVVQEMYFQEAANYQEQISDHIEKETDLDAMPEGLTKEQLLQKTRDSLKEKFGMTDEEIDQYAENALTAIDARNQYNEVFTGYRDALIEQGIDDNKASAAAQILSASALSLAIQNKTTAQEIAKRRNLKFEREKFDKNKYNPQYKTEEGDYIPFQFAGEKAVGAELNKLQEAKQLSKKGLLSNEEIRKQTGWFKGKDGKWRFEISDKDATVDIDFIKDMRKSSKDYENYHLDRINKELAELTKKHENNEISDDDYKLESYRLLDERAELHDNANKEINEFSLYDVLDHKFLFEAYPDLKNLQIRLIEGSPSLRGSYNRLDDIIEVNVDMLNKPEELKSTLMHEIQHFIQETEGFASGGSIKTQSQLDFSSMFGKIHNKAVMEVLGKEKGAEYLAKEENLSNKMKSDDADLDALLEQVIELNEEYGLEYGSENQKKIEDRIKELEQKSGRNLDEYEFYRNLYGEIEARNTQVRMNLSDEERLAKSPQSTQDVSDNDAIVVFDDGSTVNYNIYYQTVLAKKTDISTKTDPKLMREDAKKYLKDVVRKQNIEHPKLGKIRVSNVGIKEFLHYTGNLDKLALVPHLKELIETSKVGDIEKLKHPRKDNIVAFYSLYNDAIIDGKPYNITIKIGVDNKGNLFYTLLLDNNSSQNGETGTKTSATMGATNISITPNYENVNSKVQNQGDEFNPRGAYEIANHVIKLFEEADTSTLIHELGHFFLEELKDYGDTKQGAEMLSSVYDYLGVKDGAITKEQHELFADSFEKYILNGKAPNSTLAKCFQAFARWLRNLKFEVQRLGYVKLNDDIVKNFDKMLGGKAIDFAMQNSSLQMQEMFDSGVIPRHVIDKAIKLLEDGKISRSDLDDIVSKLRAGEMKNKEVFAELNRLEGLNIQHYEQLNPFDTMKYRQQLSNRNFEKSKVIEKIERLVEWSKPRMAGGKEVGRFPNKQLNDYFTNVRNLLALSKDDARAKIAENLDKLGTMFTSENAIDDSETRDALIFENKILSIPAKRTTGQGLIDVYNGLSESYNLGRLSDSITKRAKKERRDAMINDALQVITGHKTVSASIEQGKIKQFLNQLGTSQYSWQGILDVLSMNDKTSKSGQSVLSKMLDVFDAEQQEAKGIADDGEIFSEIAANKFASTNNSKIALSKYIDDELQKTITIEWGTHKKRFTKDQLIDIYMKSLDPETREIMVNDEINGFDNNFLNIVNQELTSDDFAFADALFEFYKQNYDKINPYYEDRFGISLGKRDYYSPRSMERTGTNLDTGDVISYAGFGNIKKRTVKKQGTLKIKGAFSTFNQYIVNSNHYLSWSEKLIDINAIFGNVEIKNAIRNIFGNQMLSRIDYEISRFASNDTFQKKFSLGVNFNKLRSNYAKSVLGLKPSLMIKQLTSFPAYLENMNSAEFISGVTDFFSNMKEAVDTLGNTTLMKTRGTNIIKDFAELSKLDVLKGKSGLKFSDAMMINIKLGDRGAIYIGGWALYKAELKKNLAKGMSNEQAKQKALETFERVTDETQQSGRMSQQSYWQSNPFLRAFTMFQSSQNQYFRKELNAIRGLATGRMDAQKAAKTIFIYHFLLPMLFQFASDGFDWDKDAQLRTAVIGSLNGVFVLSALLGKLYDAATIGSFSSGTMRVRDVIPFVGSIEDMNKFLVKLVEGEVEPDWSDFMDVLETFSKPLQTAGELSGLPLKYPLDVIKNFGRYAEDDEYKKEVLLWLGWSPYALRDKE